MRGEFFEPLRLANAIAMGSLTTRNGETGGGPMLLLDLAIPIVGREGRRISDDLL